MEHPSSVTELVDLWPSRRELAWDVGVMTDRVHKWAKVNAIPAGFHNAVLTAAAKRGFAVTAEDMVKLHDRSRHVPS